MWWKCWNGEQKLANFLLRFVLHNSILILTRSCTCTDTWPPLPTSAGHLERHSGTESCGHDVPHLWTQQEVRLNKVSGGGALEKKLILVLTIILLSVSIRNIYLTVLYWVQQATFNSSAMSGRENLQLCVGPLLHTMLFNIEEKLQGTSSEPNRLDTSGWKHPFLKQVLIVFGLLKGPIVKSSLKQEVVFVLCTWHHSDSLSDGYGDFWHEMATLCGWYHSGAAPTPADQRGLH